MIIASPIVWATFGEIYVAFFIIDTRLNADKHEFSFIQPVTPGHRLNMAQKYFTKPGMLVGVSGKLFLVEPELNACTSLRLNEICIFLKRINNRLLKHTAHLQE